MVCDEAKQPIELSGCQNFAIWCIFMKNDGMMSNGKPDQVVYCFHKFHFYIYTTLQLILLLHLVAAGLSFLNDN